MGSDDEGGADAWHFDSEPSKERRDKRAQSGGSGGLRRHGRRHGNGTADLGMDSCDEMDGDGSGGEKYDLEVDENEVCEEAGDSPKRFFYFRVSFQAVLYRYER